MTPKIQQEAHKKILLMDGGMGTAIQDYKLTEADYRGSKFAEIETDQKGNNDLLSLTQPQIIQDIYRKFFDAGSDLIETNTFSSTTVGMADYHMEDYVYELNFQSAILAKELADEYTAANPSKPRFVLGSIGPTNRTTSLSPDVNRPAYRAITFDELKEAYSEQVIGLIDGGVDALLVETIFDTLNAKAALMACVEVMAKKDKEIPLMVSGTITDASGRTLSGQTLEAFLIALEHFPLMSIGLNCAMGAESLIPYMKELRDKTNLLTSCYPNAGLPNAFGEYDQSPTDMASQVKPFIDQKLVNIIGGCCGTTPEHIAEIYKLIQTP